MIPVTRQAEPANFELRVRQRGRDWLTRNGHPLIGALPRRTELPDYWSECAAELRTLYGGVCAYMAVYIPEVVGSATVEHYKPKLRYAEHAYEWNNYRFVCGLLNSCKNNFEDVLDPFEIQPGTFQLTPSLKVEPGETVKEPVLTHALDTIKRLKLNDPDRLRLRTRLWELYLKRKITAEALREESLFISDEMVRLQGMDANATGLCTRQP